MSKIAIIIPARYGSTRFPGKPLAKIGEKTMLQLVYENAQKAAEGFDNVSVYVTTEDQRIANHAKGIGAPCLMTSDQCPTGSDRVLEAAKQLEEKPDFVINLQGDAPHIEVSTLVKIIGAYQSNPDLQVVTPVHRLTWDALDKLRENKKQTPFSGTTAIINSDNNALWFSKNIIPAIRKEVREEALSPVYKHLGLYGYSFEALDQFCALPQGHYEQLEGLEQLRFLENGIAIYTVEIINNSALTGIDTPEDLERFKAATA